MLDPKVVKTMALVTQIGISMLVPILLMLYIGIWLEERYDIKLIPVFIILGILAGFRNCYILITHAAKDSKRGRKNDEKAE